MQHNNPSLSLAFGFSFEDLYDDRRLAALDEVFLKQLSAAAPAIEKQLRAGRANPVQFTPKETSQIVLDAAPYFEDFVAELFGIGAELRAMQAQHEATAPLFSLKRRFVFKKAVSGVTKQQAEAIDAVGAQAELETLFGEPLTETAFVRHVTRWMDNEKDHQAELAVAAQYAAWAALTDEGRYKHRLDVIFKLPQKLDATHLVPVETTTVHGASAFQLHPDHWRNRDGFDLTDEGADLEGALGEANYCIKYRRAPWRSRARARCPS